MKRKFKLAGWFFIGIILFVTCKEEYPLPTASFTYAVTGNTVTFYAQVSNDSKYEWDFGDGSYIYTLHSPVHAYPEYGKDYTVSLTIKGPGGEVTVTNKVTIPPMPKIQLLTGGTTASPKSKKWRFNINAPFLDVTYADANFTSAIPAAYRTGSVLGMVGLQNAYKDEFVFKSDGTMTFNSKGGGVLTSIAYCMANSIPPTAVYADLGMAYAPFTAPASAAFAINEGKNYTVTTPVGAVTYSNVITLSFTNGGFLGLRDFSVECIIKKLTDSEMNAIIFYAHPQYGVKPMLALNVTLEAVQ